jgi:FTO catalytic domain/FTO C-terminal domain
MNLQLALCFVAIHAANPTYLHDYDCSRMGRRNKSKKRKAPSTSLSSPKSFDVVTDLPKPRHSNGRSASHFDDIPDDIPDVGGRIPPNAKRIRQHRLPLPFPPDLPRPQHGFLRDVAPYRESFQAALQTSYQGVAVDENRLPPKEKKGQPNSPLLQECSLQEALRSIQSYFVTDVTQPFGLGTPCTPTYVTRCLLGETGTTYKYLGLRMFAHDWKRTVAVEQLKDILSERVTQHHLPALFRQRNATTDDLPHANTDDKPCFDICLINRMTWRPNLKTEALDERYKIAVSWHADSSLDHFSTIAVYQTMLPEEDEPMSEETTITKKNTKQVRTDAKVMSPSHDSQQEWSIGLRVMHCAEGPKRAGATTEKEDDTISSAPPIAVSLPSNSAYYLLDDFNHHHQHTVLVTPSNAQSKSVRYSLTYRLLRESHNVTDMIERCQRCVAQFHKKGSKVYRYEQLTLTELESEWLRQFYIQGSHHHSILWEEWQDYISHLWNYWSQLESRTFQTIQFLQHAAEGACSDASTLNRANDSSFREDVLPAIGKSERKLREKRRKAYMTMKELTKRENPSLNTISGDLYPIYESLASLLVERATMRELWSQRELEPAFQKMDEQYRPLPLPVQFNIASTVSKDGCSESATMMSRSNDTNRGLSPVPGAPTELRQIAVAIRAWGLAFQSENRADLPTDIPAPFSILERKPSETDLSPRTSTSESDGPATTLQPLDWFGWSNHLFGLEMQYPWSSALLKGRKSIETRAYPLPSGLIGKKIWIIETPTGRDGLSGIVGNHFCFPNDGRDISGGSDVLRPRLVGWCIFSSVKQYSSRQDFEMDEKCHLVPSHSNYGWNDDEAKIVYGWFVGDYGSFDSHDDRPLPSGIRRFRSLFQLTPDGWDGHDHTNSALGADSHIPTISTKKRKQISSQGISCNRTNSGCGGSIRKKRRY